jgi:hypothetical protein
LAPEGFSIDPEASTPANTLHGEDTIFIAKTDILPRQGHEGNNHVRPFRASADDDHLAGLDFK